MISIEAHPTDRSRFYVNIDGKTVEGRDCQRYLNFEARAEDWPSAFDREELADLLPDIIQELFHGKQPFIRRIRFYRTQYIPAHLERVYEK